jgi:large subunit ribosomal protein L18
LKHFSVSWQNQALSPLLDRLELVSSSTVDKELKAKLKGNKCDQASLVGQLLAQRAKKKKLESVAFDRAGYKYHGRVKALADAAREAGLEF